MSIKAERKLTGRHVLLMLLAFFGVMLAVNAYFVVMAVTSFRGEDVPRSYRQGLEYNQTLTARGLQNELGWTAQVNKTEAQIILAFHDAEGRPLNHLNIEAKLRHPVDTARDLPLTFIQDSKGRYAADIKALNGRWLLVAKAQTDQQDFKFEYELWD